MGSNNGPTNLGRNQFRRMEPQILAKKEASQMPIYDDKEELNKAVAMLSKCSPLVFAREVRSLHKQLTCITQGQRFLLMGIDCTEMVLMLTFGSAMPVVKVGHMVGQFTKQSWIYGHK
eukprot:14315472-Ditylum_brightwellii.AAC.1